jgi:hypothetical protein
LGWIHRIKGVDILVRAFAVIVEKLNDVKLVVVCLKHIVLDGVVRLMVVWRCETTISSILSLYNDECRAEEMGLRGRQFLKESFIENAADRLLL